MINKSLLLIVITTFLILPLQVLEISAEEQPIRLIVNGDYYDLGKGVKPIVKNQRLFLPMTTIQTLFNCSTNYTVGSNTVYLNKEDIAMLFIINSTILQTNGKKSTLDASPFIEQDMIYLPIRVIADQLHVEIKWDASNRILLLGDYTEKTSTYDTFIYSNEAYGYHIRFPNAWKDKVLFETISGQLSVYDKMTMEYFIEEGGTKGGPVFQIVANETPLTPQFPGTSYVLDYQDGLYIEASFNTDIQYFPETKDAYFTLYHQALIALRSFQRID